MFYLNNKIINFANKLLDVFKKPLVIEKNIQQNYLMRKQILFCISILICFVSFTIVLLKKKFIFFYNKRLSFVELTIYFVA